YHLHALTIDGQEYGDPDPDFDVGEVVDERGKRLGALVTEVGAVFDYAYDFGDGWHHDIELVSMGIRQPGSEYPRVIDGRRACPPEDVGGPDGYADFLEALRGRRSRRRTELLEWVGGDFDPEAFDLAITNEALAITRAPWDRSTRR
ncbi:MAG: plasmid pRiA4b ORF-3 family protein, partial [Candidatus Limnocylindrales bacterium]